MEYNTTRSFLTIPEYGRNIQTMIEHLFTIEDKAKRTQGAQFIVNIMAQMNPQVKETSDYFHKLWDHLNIIGGYKLDIDCPYPMPEKEAVNKKLKAVTYSNNRIRYGHYGQNIINIIKKATEYEDGAEKDALVHTVANHMKKLYLSWNRDSVNDLTIEENLTELSNGKLKIPEEARLTSTNEILAKNGLLSSTPQANKKKKYTQRRDNQSFQRKKQR